MLLKVAMSLAFSADIPIGEPWDHGPPQAPTLAQSYDRGIPEPRPRSVDTATNALLAVIQGSSCGRRGSLDRSNFADLFKFFSANSRKR